MIKRQIGKVLRPFVLLMLLLTVGCVQQMKSVQPDAAPGALVDAEIKSITVSADASRIEILSTKPIVYTYYMLETPPRLVVDLAQTSTGTLLLPIEVNKGSIKRIDVAKHEFGSGVLSRVDVLLTDKVEVVAALDQQNNNRLILNFPVPQTPPPAENVPVTAAVVATLQPAQGAEAVQIVDPTPVSGDAKEVGKEDQVTKTAEMQKPVSSDQGAHTTESSATAAPPVSEVASKRQGGRGLTAITRNANSIQLEIAGEIDSFKSFRLNQPERLVVDIPKVKSSMSVKSVDINGFNLGKARVGGSPDKLRIVFDGVNGVIPVYTITRNSRGLLLAFGEAQENVQGGAVPPLAAASEPVETPAAAAVAEGSKELAAQPVAAAMPLENVQVKSTVKGTVDAVEFSQADGISRITIKTNGNCNAGQPAKTAKGLSLTLNDCRLPGNLQRQLDTSGFASAIKSIAPYSVKGKKPQTRIAVNLHGTLPNSLRRVGDTLQWDFTERAATIKSAKPAKVAKTSFSTVDSSPAELNRDVTETPQEKVKSNTDKTMEDAFTLDKSAQTTSKHGKTFTGRKVTLEFSDADIRKIFQLLAEVSNQNFLISDDVTGTISLKLVNVPWDQALDVILENKGLGMERNGNIVQIRPKTKMKSLDDEAIEMRFTEEKRMPLSTVIFDVNFATLADIETQFKYLKSKRIDSSVSSDMRTNKVIVVDIDPNIRKMRLLLESLDIPEKQVMIEARIVEAESTFARDIGVKWNFGYQDGSASVANINNITSSLGGVVSPILPSLTTGGIAAGMSFGKLISNIQLDMRLSAAATIGQLKIISTPKVMTVNNKSAKISQGQMIPYQNTSSTDGAKTEFIEAALSLEVTPHITADGSISMKIKASNNTAGTGNPPPINKKEATTELVVKNGETTVIGGIYVDRDTESDTGVPYLSEIPLLGWLFKSNSKGKTKNELLIFITPRIMN